MSKELQPGGYGPEAGGFPADLSDASLNYQEPPEITINEGTATTLENPYVVRADELIAEPVEQRIQGALHDLAATTDWRKLVEEYAAGKNDMDLGLLKAIFVICTDAERVEGEPEHVKAESYVDSLRKIMVKKEYVLSPSEQIEAPETASDTDTPEVGKTWHTWYKHWNDAKLYLSDRHRFAIADRIPAETFNKLQDGIAIFLRCGEIATKNPTTAALGGALETKSAELFDAFKVEEQEYLDSGTQSPPEINNIALLTERTGIGEEEIKKCIKGHPEPLRRGIQRISFVDDIPPGGTERTGGNYRQLKRDINIRVFPGEDPVWTISKLNHEILHHAHHCRMTIEMLSEWHDITQKEDVAVTPYVAEKRGKETGHMEDIADSGRLYFDYPADLHITAPQRFAWFQKYYHRYKDEGIEKAKREIVAMRAAKNQVS